jgi:selenoprotein W-related protein
LKAYEPEIEEICLVPSDGGRFEVETNGRLLFSKLNGGRHAQPGEVKGLVGNFLEDHSK